MKELDIDIGGKFFHILKENKINYLPKQIIFYDCETKMKNVEIKKKLKKDNGDIIKAVQHSLRLGYYEYWFDRNLKEEGFFYNKKEFFNKIMNRFLSMRNTLYIFAHNAGFDFRVGMDLKLFEKDFNVVCNIISSNHFILIMKHKTTRRKIVFLDSFNFIKFSIEAIGEKLGIKKIQIKDFKRVGDKKLKLRCKVDVEILREIMFELFDFIEIKTGKFKYTIAGLSFNTFRHSFMDKPIYIHANLQAHILERKSYMGGRVEAFQLGKIEPKKKKYRLDVNSMYPKKMRDEYYPTKLIKILTNITLGALRDLTYSDKYLIIADVLLETEKPCVPYYDKENNKLIFPIGKFRTVLTTPELQQDIKIIKCYEISIYEKAKIFTTFIKYFYNKRKAYKKEKNIIFDLFSKLFMNSLYGKFGQKNGKWERDEEYDNIFSEDGYYELVDKDNELKKIKIFKGEAWVNIGYYEFKEGFVAIASFVTAYARKYLYELLNILDYWIYCDTDSLYVLEEELFKFKKLINKNKLGALKIEGEGKHLKIYGLKDYEFNKEIKIKGINLKKVIKRDENNFVIQHFTGFNESFHYFDINNVYEIEIKKTLKREYKKGIVEKNGEISPIKLNESD